MPAAAAALWISAPVAWTALMEITSCWDSTGSIRYSAGWPDPGKQPLPHGRGSDRSRDRKGAILGPGGSGGRGNFHAAEELGRGPAEEGDGKRGRQRHQ